MTQKRVTDDEGDFAGEDARYDSHLGLGVANSWWDLGRWTNRLRATPTNAARQAVAREWAEDANEDDPYYHVKPQELVAFTDTVLGLLERKLNGERIAAEAKRLVAPIAQVEYDDDGQFLARRENAETFWATEYYYLFEDLERREHSVWSKAVGYCENKACGKFFIRQRIDNRYDTDKCRTNDANRKYYRRRVRAHGGTK